MNCGEALVPNMGTSALLLVCVMSLACSGEITEPEGAPLVEARIENVAIGDTHLCAVDDGGNVFCAGEDGLGQLGDGPEVCDGNLNCSGVPVSIMHDSALVSVSAGGNMTCGVDSAGRVFCWGHDAAKGLGARGNDRCSDATGTTQVPCIPIPREIETPVPIRLLSVGGARIVPGGVAGGPVCGIGVDSLAYCWGRGEGALGNGSLSSSSIPVAVAGGRRFTLVDVSETGRGKGHPFVCGVVADNESLSSVYCWGQNRLGQLGIGDTQARTVPVAVATARSFVQVSAGEDHVCALDDTGAAYCWGGNSSGQLGNSTTVASLKPIAVSSSEILSQISAGVGYTCALNEEGTAFCWGNNSFGQLGLGEGVFGVLVPVPVAGTLRFESLAAGASYTCGVRKGGAVFCWGRNLGGQMGQGPDRSDVQLPTPIPFRKPAL